MKNKIKIAHVAKNFNVNGISTVILSYARQLDHNKYSIDIYAGEPISRINRNSIIKSKNIKLIKTPSKNIKNFLKYVSFLKENLKGYDIVHVHGNSRLVLIELSIAKTNHNKKIIAHSHSTSCEHIVIHKLLKPFFDSSYDYGIACSKKAGKWMFGEKHFEIANNNILADAYRFDKTARIRIREELKINNDIKLIGHVGNFSDVKNYPFILTIFNKICDNRDDFKLILIGKYQNNARLERYIKNSKNSDKILLAGTKKEVAKYYSAMDCFIFPSKYEGLGIATIEAQLSGLKCYASNKLSNETRITNNIKYLPIYKKNAANWANQIINDSETFNKNRTAIAYTNRHQPFARLDKTYDKILKETHHE